jgi:hypothetical protein
MARLVKDTIADPLFQPLKVLMEESLLLKPHVFLPRFKSFVRLEE